MQSLSRSIARIAGKLDGVDGTILRALPGEAYAAHGRTRLNHSLRSSADKVARAADRLNALAGELGHAAAVLHRDQSTWDAEKRERRDREAQLKAEEAHRAAAARQL